MTNKFFERHVFFCTNQRPEGHPKGCCASKNSTVLRAYMKKKTKELTTILNENNIKFKQDFEVDVYNSPFQFINRRNEITVSIISDF